MRSREFLSSSAVAVMVTLGFGLSAPTAGMAQSATTGAAKATSTWKVPRTVDGQPDLQGIWANNSATPLERPKAVAGRDSLTDAEVVALQKRADELFANGENDAAFADGVFEAALSEAKKFTSRDAGTGDYSSVWLVDRQFDKRTSLVVDPPDGRIPAMTPEAQAKMEAGRAARKLRPADGPEDRGLSERCITFGIPDTLAGYNSNAQILQTAGHLVIASERIHDARIIPLDGRPPLAGRVRQWHGDSRGRWDGDTLVVETTNFSGKSSFRGASESVRLVERFTRTAPDTLQYEFTISDPATWTRPWTVRMFWKRSKELIYEYACHEGNLGLTGILAGHRAQEK